MKQISLPESTVETVAGGFAGICQVLVGHPFDTIKVRMQTQASNHGAIENALNILKHEGASAFYKGVTSPIMGIAACNSVLFAANGFFQRHILQENIPHALQLDRVALSGSLSGIVMAGVNCPVELLKVRLQIQDHSAKNQRYKNIFDCAFKTVRSDGPVGLYRGLSATLLRDFPSFASYFAVYEAMKHRLHNSPLHDSLWNPIISGGFAGIAAWLPCYPQDVIKSVIQSSSSKLTLLQAIKKIHQTSGYSGFFKGFGPTMVRAFPANAATFVGYEIVMKTFRK